MTDVKRSLRRAALFAFGISTLTAGEVQAQKIFDEANKVFNKIDKVFTDIDKAEQDIDWEIRKKTQPIRDVDRNIYETGIRLGNIKYQAQRRINQVMGVVGKVQEIKRRRDSNKELQQIQEQASVFGNVNPNLTIARVTNKNNEEVYALTYKVPNGKKVSMEAIYLGNTNRQDGFFAIDTQGQCVKIESDGSVRNVSQQIGVGGLSALEEIDGVLFLSKNTETGNALYAATQNGSNFKALKIGDNMYPVDEGKRITFNNLEDRPVKMETGAHLKGKMWQNSNQQMASQSRQGVSR